VRTAWHDAWGSATGPASRALPGSRLVAGTLVFAACMVAPVATAAGAACAVGATAAWLAACRPPGRFVVATLVLGLALFLPYFLLAPLIPDAAGGGAGGWSEAVLVPWSILVRGLCAMLACAATVSCLGAGDLHEAMASLPIPSIVTRILIQMVHQTSTLAHESRRMASAMAVRGATGGGAAARRVVGSLPRVWLPRVVDRAERVAAAMDLRGYCDGEVEPVRARRATAVDGVVVALAAVLLAAAIAARSGVS